jgi:hypothetical protein
MYAASESKNLVSALVIDSKENGYQTKQIYQ